MTEIDPRSLKILLVDDEHYIRSTIRQILVQIGIPQSQVYEAGNVKDGISQVVRIRPSLVLCDLHMPGLDGFEFVNHMSQSPVEEILLTPIVMLTADASEEAVMTARSLKISGYVVKPVSARTLQRAIERALGVTLQ